MTTKTISRTDTHGEFIYLANERYYAIRNVDKMKPFFISVVSNVDHWMFVSSNGGLTAGRVSPKTALFPYVTVDKIHESTPHTGCKTLVRIDEDGIRNWEPFNREHDGIYDLTRNIYKNTLGNKLCFEEINHTLQLTFRYSWSTSDRFGFVRESELVNDADSSRDVEFVDGLRNLLPAGTPAFAQTNTSNLVDAYKWTELDVETGLAYLCLYSGITDRAEPSESLKATTIFSLGLDKPTTLISARQLARFRAGEPLEPETHTRGMRGAYLVSQSLNLTAHSSRSWRLVADVEQSQSQVVALRKSLIKSEHLNQAISDSIEKGSRELAHIMARSDGFQATNEENVAVHHYANVLFNVLRGGIFDNQYKIPTQDFAQTIKHFNSVTYAKNEAVLNALPEVASVSDIVKAVNQTHDAQLQRLTAEYLPITFGRRHGDPSRPWNQFTINVKDKQGDRVLSYEGNWRDIFQNWEALLFSYPQFTESVIAKFVNASTIDGYNPYRITKEGIDWEVEEPDNPWSYIGYWGDHQIIYLQKLLELSNDFHPDDLIDLLGKSVFSYANVPYRIVNWDNVVLNPKDTVRFDQNAADRIDDRVARLGADGKLILDSEGQVYLVNLVEKLLVPLLSKLGNLVVDGGVWLTTQRPEWNDANNALVGHGLSMVTLYYMRRYVSFLHQLLANREEDFALSTEVDTWFRDTSTALTDIAAMTRSGSVSEADRYQAQKELGKAASEYRRKVYEQETFSGKTDCSSTDIANMLSNASEVIDYSIGKNLREDGLYHAYNLIGISDDKISVDNLYPMLEGQVAVLSAGSLEPEEVVAVLDALFSSNIYRDDQDSFMLYPDRALPGFLEKNQIDANAVARIDLLSTMLESGDERIVLRDEDGHIRFNADFTNVNDLNDRLDQLDSDYGDSLAIARPQLVALYESVFNHKAFTGRSGTMFGFEGLGSIYWHMVSKLLLAVMENFFTAVNHNAKPGTIKSLGKYYYRVRDGIGFNKTPTEYGAFPTDPYSHTPKHSGARQPGMTGQVKEEVLCRFAELGVRVQDGKVRFQPALLRKQEFVQTERDFHYADTQGNWHVVKVPAQGLVFTWCQVPIVYTLTEGSSSVTITDDSGKRNVIDGLNLDAATTRQVTARDGHITRIDVVIDQDLLFTGT